MTNEQPKQNGERLTEIERRVVKGEVERERMLTELQELGGRFDRHENRVMDRMEQGNEWMRQMNDSITHVTVSFESFVEWFKFAFKWSALILLGIVGPAVTAFGLYLAYYVD